MLFSPTATPITWADLAAILDNFRPKVLWIGAEPETPEWREIREAAMRDGVRIVPLTRGSR